MKIFLRNNVFVCLSDLVRNEGGSLLGSTRCCRYSGRRRIHTVMPTGPEPLPKTFVPLAAMHCSMCSPVGKAAPNALIPFEIARGGGEGVREIARSSGRPLMEMPPRFAIF